MSTTAKCLWRVERGEICGAPSVGTITIKDLTGSAKVPVCAKHKAEHDRRAAQLRVKN